MLKRYHEVGSTLRREAVLNEGRALAKVRSPYVAQCYELETSGDELDLVMEYVPGRSLNELTADERADTEHCARLVEQVAAGLAEVHACGLLHRDIKPQNIILGDNGVPRLVDFGLAVSVGSGALHEISGSPPYMAPEQARGQGERVDARSDVYGLGAVLYYLLTGHAPHGGKTLTEILEHARKAPVVLPRRLNSRAPRALERICMKAMAADPQLRFPSADALRNELRRDRLTRRAAPVLGAVAVLLALIVPTWAFWPESARPSLGRPEPKQLPEAELRVTRFEITHFPKRDEKSYDKKAAGVLGKRSFMARVGDDVTVHAELSEPAHSYLIAFRPDGTNELCHPEDDDTRPAKKTQALYPSPTKSGDCYRLSEGVGLYVFVLVVSRQPLPSYREWQRQIGAMPWAANLPFEPGIVWRDDGAGPQPFLADHTREYPR